MADGCASDDEYARFVAGEMKWARACRTQIRRFAEASRRSRDADRARRGPRPDANWDALEQAHIEGYFLIMAAHQLCTALAGGPHADLLGHVPLPWFVDGTNPDAASDGADYIRHVRNANDHDDERGLFEKSYEFSHRWMITSSEDPLDANVHGLELRPFAEALDVIAVELERRR